MRKSKNKQHVFRTFLVFVSVFVLAGAGYAAYRAIAPSNNEAASSIESEKPEEEAVANQEDAQKQEIETQENAKDEEKVKEQPITFFQDSGTTEEKVASLMDNMTLEEKIGQLLIVGFQTPEPDEHIKQMIKDYHVGGVILFDRNMENPAQVADLTNELQDIALTNEQQIPLSFSVDQEGGQIVRMKEHVSSMPAQQELGKRGDKEEIHQLAVRTGEELAAMGFTINFAPVLDLSATDSRSFGLDPENTRMYGSQVISGLVEGGVTATVKHFPGNGRSDIDPHKETSSVQADQLDLENSDIYPFKKIIQEMDNSQFFVMVTHIKYPAYDTENPASISSKIIQDLLRKKLNYQGIVVTDDLEMGAVNKYFTYEDLGYKAVQSGADLLLVCHTLENQKKVFNGIMDAVKSSKLSEERIDEAVKRILTFKFQSIKNIKVDPDKAKQIVGG